jgi:amidohydrolase
MSTFRGFPVLFVSILAAAPLVAQTTDTERAAAGPVMQRIDALQSQIQPERQARRLISAGSADKQRVLQRVEELWSTQMQSLSDHIGHNPEIGFEEHTTVDTLTRVLRAHGFQLQTGVAELETAFVGSWDSPAGVNGPTLGIIVEYDALRGTTEAFHGCQHNAQSPVGFAAGIALMELMQQKRLPGRIRIYGTPAEEMGPPAKVTMWQAGVFKGTDILVRSHGAGETSRNRAGFGVCCLNINMVRYIYEGRPAHQRSSWNGRNALSAAVQFYTAVDHLRPSLRPESVIQGVIPEGGAAPNVVPDRAVVDYYIRYPDEVYLAHIDSMMANAARAAALATGTKVTIDRYGEYRDGITLGSLEELVFAYAQDMGANQIVAEPQRPAGYEETGFVTRDIPGVGVSVFSSPAPGHSYERWKDSLAPVGHQGFLLDAKIMAAVLYDFLSDAKFRETVALEHKTMAGLFDQYLAGLRQAYGSEIGIAAGN